MKLSMKSGYGLAAALSLGFAAVQSPLAQAAKCEYVVQNEWNSGFVALIKITNTGASEINGWDVAWRYDDGSLLSNSWSAQLSGANPYRAANMSWNGRIAPGQTIEFGMQGAKGAAAAPVPVVTGDVCDDSGAPDNHPPVAAFTASVSVGDAPLPVVFDASASSDPDNDALSYQWDFGDGSSATGVKVSHDYVNPGDYNVTLTVSDGAASVTASQSIRVKQPDTADPVTASFTSSVVDKTVSVNAAASTGDNLTYIWDFGDGATASGVSASHTYAEAGTYSIQLTVSDGEQSDRASKSVTVEEGDTDPGDDPAHVSNPFAGAKAYINPDYAKQVDASMAKVDASLAAKMATLKDTPTAVWLDRIDAIYGGDVNGGRLSLEQHLEAALAQKDGDDPITATFVVYNLPDRDCAALASNGTLHSDQNGLAIYKSDYIDVIYDVMSDPRFRDIRIVTVIEPDSLPNLVTNRDIPECAKVAQNGVYVDGVQYAISRLSQLPNVYLYLDIAHSGWLGWESNFGPAVQLFTQVVKGASGGDLSVIDGFVSNVANYTPTEEVYLPDPSLRINGQEVRSSKFYEWNLQFDEKGFANNLHQAFVNAGFPSDLGLLIDTSRNGWGGDERPTGPDASASTVDNYVTAARLDRRFHRGNWCNADGAGVGERPRAAPFGADAPVDAFIWIKPPGESDGTSDPSQTTPDDEGKSFDPMCSPDYVGKSGYPTGAKAGAPAAGHWFHEQFRMLVENAYPPIE
ncbi:glycoside hydrolase family 6 protein [Hahella sp. CR1]|uniref:glycoside hydrolase family 6 protein n=1 Tax=Hahella sp. CR1 TaxID=2992807 RepID=UPI0024434968|nr:glycoside hydrolase family 6 protein [Hahella sp. CR1]MDG9666411.1 glycoside hydrolase family 6 protein [Hahella sp. CR1]